MEVQAKENSYVLKEMKVIHDQLQVIYSWRARRYRVLGNCDHDFFLM